MRSLIVKVIEGGFFALLLAGGLLLVSRTWSESTSAVVVAVSPTPPQFSPAEQEAIDRAKQYLRDHAKEYYLQRPDLSDLRVSRLVDDGREFHVWFEQLYQGIPVFGSEIGVHIRKDGKGSPLVPNAGNPRPQVILRPGTGPYPGPNAPTLTPTLSAEDAAARAFTATGAKSRFQAPPAKAELVVYPIVKPGSQPLYTLAWQVRLVTTDPFGDWGVVVDAWNGEILVKDNHFVPEPTVPGSQPFQSPVPIGPTPTFIPPTPVIIIGPAPKIDPLVTPTPPVPPPAVTPAGPAPQSSPPPPIRIDKTIVVPAPTVSPTPPKTSLLAPSGSAVVERANCCESKGGQQHRPEHEL